MTAIQRRRTRLTVNTSKRPASIKKIHLLLKHRKLQFLLYTAIVISNTLKHVCILCCRRSYDTNNFQ